MKRTIFVSLAVVVFSPLLFGCDTYTKPTAEDVKTVLAKNFERRHVKYKDLSIEDLNCARESAVFTCTFTIVSRERNWAKSDEQGKDVFYDELTRGRGARMKIIKGDEGWMEA